MENMLKAISEEIELKRINPKYLFKLLISNLEDISKKIEITNEDIQEQNERLDDVIKSGQR